MEWEIRVREWGICYWSGDFPFGVGNCIRSGELTIGVGRIRRHHFGVGNCRSGVGRLFLMWAIIIGVGHQIVEWEIALGVGRLLLGWGNLGGLPARFYRRIEPPTVSDLTHAPTARPKLRNSWSGASFSASDSPGTD